VGGCRLDLSGSGQRPVVDPCEHGNETGFRQKADNFLSS